MTFMPQMYPLNWIVMLIFFSFCFYSSMSLIYFTNIIEPKMSNDMKIKLYKKTLNKCW